MAKQQPAILQPPAFTELGLDAMYRVMNKLVQLIVLQIALVLSLHVTLLSALLSAIMSEDQIHKPLPSLSLGQQGGQALTGT